MPRRARAIKKRATPDAKYQSVDLAKFIHKIMLDGKKSTAERIVYSALDMAERELKKNPLDIFEQVVRNLTSLREQVHKLGCRHESPFMILSFLCLSAIPKLKITDIGLIDVSRFRVVPLFTQ